MVPPCIMQLTPKKEMLISLSVKDIEFGLLMLMFRLSPTMLAEVTVAVKVELKLYWQF